MSKSKSATKTEKSSKDVFKSVKSGAIAKTAQPAKDVAKKAVVVASKEKSKKSKKVKEPTPEPSDESESESSESSSSSESEGEEEDRKPALNGKAHNVKPAKKDESSDDEDDDSEESDEEAAPKTNGSAKVADAVKAGAKNLSDDSESGSDDASDSGSEAESDGDASDASSDSDDSDVSDNNADSKADREIQEESKASKRKAVPEEVPAAKKAKVAEDGTPQSSNLFVGNVSWNVDEAWLREFFEEFGEIARVQIMTDRQTGRSKGFGYVEFANVEDAVKAHAAKQGAELDHRAINVDFANARPDNKQAQDNRRKSYGDQVSEPSDTLFLGNLSFEVGQEDLTMAFAPHGTVLGIRLPTDRDTGAPKGFGYVTFASIDEAKYALEQMQGAYIANRPVRLDYSQPRPQNNGSPARGRGGFGGFGGRGGGGRGGRGGNFGGRGGSGGGRGASTNRGGFGDFSGKKTNFDA